MNFADSYYKKNIIGRMVGKEDLLTVFCVATNMPLVECSIESFNDRVYVFAEESLLKTFAQPYFEKKLPVKGVRYPAADKMRFFTSLLYMNVDEIVYVDKTGRHVIALADFLRRQDFSKLPPAKRPIENPQLQLAGVYFAQEASRNVPQEEKSGLKELEEELAANMVKAVYILPADFLPDENGNQEITPAQAGPQTRQFRLPLLKGPGDQKFLPIFTDQIEFSKYNRENKLKALAVPFANLEKMLVKEAAGYMLNPNGFHLLMPRELLKGLKIRFPQAAADKASQPPAPAPDEPGKV